MQSRVDPSEANTDGSRRAFTVAPLLKEAPPSPHWQIGSGLNEHPEASRFVVGANKFKSIHMGKTQVEAPDIYRLMLGGVQPRPIALVGTLSPTGVPNLAPISWFEMLSHDPPLCVVSFGGDSSRRKDSEQNLRDSGVFTISMSCEPYAEALNAASIDAPRGTSEFTIAGLTPVMGDLVKAPRVGEAPFAMELELDHAREYKNDAGQHTTTVVIGRVKVFHVREDCLTDDGTGTLDPAKTLPVARMGGLLYSRPALGYELARPKWSDVKDTDVGKQASSSEAAPKWAESTSEAVAKWP